MFNTQSTQLIQTKKLSNRLLLSNVNDHNNFYRRLVILRALVKASFESKRVQLSDVKLVLDNGRINVVVCYLSHKAYDFPFLYGNGKWKVGYRFFKTKVFKKHHFDAKEETRKRKRSVLTEHENYRRLSYRSRNKGPKIRSATLRSYNGRARNDYVFRNGALWKLLIRVKRFQKVKKLHLLLHKLRRLKALNRGSLFNRLLKYSVRKCLVLGLTDAFTSFNSSLNKEDSKVRSFKKRKKKKKLLSYAAKVYGRFLTSSISLPVVSRKLPTSLIRISKQNCSLTSGLSHKKSALELPKGATFLKELPRFIKQKKLLNFIYTKELAFKYSLELFLISKFNLPVTVRLSNAITSIRRHRYNLTKVVSSLERHLQKRKIKFSFLLESVTTMCVATYLHNPKFILDRIKLDLRRMKYSAQRNTYFTSYMKEIIDFFMASSPRVVTMQMRVTGKVGHSVRTVKLYNPDPFLVNLVPYRRLSANIQGLSLDVKTNKGVINVALLVFYSQNQRINQPNVFNNL